MMTIFAAAGCKGSPALGVTVMAVPVTFRSVKIESTTVVCMKNIPTISIPVTVLPITVSEIKVEFKVRANWQGSLIVTW
jgi:hypothetical protein